MASGLGQLVSNPSQDRGPGVATVFWTLTGICGITAGLRLYIRISRRSFQVDDALLLLAWLCLLALAILNYILVSLGVGKHSLDVPFGNLDEIALLGAVGLTVSTIGINVAKISFACTLLHLTKNAWRWMTWVVWFVIVTLILLAIPVAILPWVQCKPLVKTFVDFWPGECIDKTISVNFGIFQVYGAATDFLLALLPWKVLWALRMRPIEKVGVGVAMSLGMVAGAMAILRSLYLHLLSSIDVSYDGIIASMWGTIELSVVIIASCIPVLRAAFKEKLSAIRSVLSRKSSWGFPSSNRAGSRGKSSKLSNSNCTSNTVGDLGTYQLTSLSGKFNAIKKKGRWFTMVDDEERLFQSNMRCQTTTPSSSPEAESNEKDNINGETAGRSASANSEEMGVATAVSPPIHHIASCLMQPPRGGVIRTKASTGHSTAGEQAVVADIFEFPEHHIASCAMPRRDFGGETANRGSSVGGEESYEASASTIPVHHIASCLMQPPRS